MPGEKIVDIMRKAGKTPSGEKSALMYGEVLAINPLKIKVDNRFELAPDSVVLSVLCQETSLWRGLQVGDVVRVLRVNSGQTFYVMEREGDLV